MFAFYLVPTSPCCVAFLLECFIDTYSVYKAKCEGDEINSSRLSFDIPSMIEARRDIMAQSAIFHFTLVESLFLEFWRGFPIEWPTRPSNLKLAIMSTLVEKFF